MTSNEIAAQFSAQNSNFLTSSALSGGGGTGGGFSHVMSPRGGVPPSGGMGAGFMPIGMGGGQVGFPGTISAGLGAMGFPPDGDLFGSIQYGLGYRQAAGREFAENVGDTAIGGVGNIAMPLAAFGATTALWSGFSSMQTFSAQAAKNASVTLGSRAAGFAGHFGSITLDPFYGGSQGWKKAARMTAGAEAALAGGGVASGAVGTLLGVGGRLAGAALGAAPALLSYQALDFITEAAQAGAERQSQIRGITGEVGGKMGFRGDKATGLFGRGMGRDRRRETTKILEDISDEDIFLDFEDVSKILKSGAGNNLLAGTTDIGEFRRRFKKLTQDVKEIALALHTSIEEATQLMGTLRTTGMGGTGGSIGSEIRGLSLAGGQSAGEVIGGMMVGSQMGRSMGAPGPGFGRLFAQQSSMFSNLMSGDNISDSERRRMQAVFGGAEDFAGGITGAAGRFSSQGFGKMLMMALQDPGGGGVNEQLTQRVMRGQASVGELTDATGRVLGTDPFGALERTHLMQERLATQMPALMVGGAASMLRESGMEMNQEGLAFFYGQLTGTSPAESRAFIGALPGLAEAAGATARATARSVSDISSQAEFLERGPAKWWARNVTKRKERLKTGIGRYFDEAAESLIKQPLIDLQDQMFGTYRANTSDAGMEAAAGRLISGTSYSPGVVDEESAPFGRTMGDELRSLWPVRSALSAAGRSGATGDVAYRTRGGGEYSAGELASLKEQGARFSRGDVTNSAVAAYLQATGGAGLRDFLAQFMGEDQVGVGRLGHETRDYLRGHAPGSGPSQLDAYEAIWGAVGGDENLVNALGIGGMRARGLTDVSNEQLGGAINRTGNLAYELGSGNRASDVLASLTMAGSRLKRTKYGARASSWRGDELGAMARKKPQLRQPLADFMRSRGRSGSSALLTALTDSYGPEDGLERFGWAQDVATSPDSLNAGGPLGGMRQGDALLKSLDAWDNVTDIASRMDVMSSLGAAPDSVAEAVRVVMEGGGALLSNESFAAAGDWIRGEARGRNIMGARGSRTSATSESMEAGAEVTRSLVHTQALSAAVLMDLVKRLGITGTEASPADIGAMLSGIVPMAGTGSAPAGAP